VDLTPRSERGVFRLEKWYIDTLMADGTVLLVYLGRTCIAGVWVSRVTAELFMPDGTAVRASAAAGRVSGGEGSLVFGPAKIRGEELTFEMEGFSGRLRFVPRYPPSATTEPFLQRGRRRLTWEIEVPDADVTGELRWPAGRLTVTGRGYRDRVWYDLLPWRFPIRELVWGRAVAGDHAATWVRATTPECVIARGWLDGAPDPQAWDKVTLGESRVIVQSAVADLETLKLGSLRHLVRRLAGDPFETKSVAPATITGANGVAIHEVVRWR